jgi:hypothetical protein
MDGQEQLAGIQGELADATRRAHEIATSLDDERWSTRPAPDQWSVAECLIHLNMTSQAFLPLIKDAIDRGRERAPLVGTRYRMDIAGRLLWLAMTVRLPMKTTEPFVPPRVQPKNVVLAAFDVLQS